MIEAALQAAGALLGDLVGGCVRVGTRSRVKAIDVPSIDRGRLFEVPSGGYTF